MTEKQFWQFLERSWKEKGRVSQFSGVVDSPDPEIQQHGQYMSRHALLPKDYEKIPEDRIREMGKLLLDKKVHRRTKEAIMIILAHIPSRVTLSILEQYNARPDRRLKIFAKIALDECQNGQPDNQSAWQSDSIFNA